MYFLYFIVFILLSMVIYGMTEGGAGVLKALFSENRLGK